MFNFFQLKPKAPDSLLCISSASFLLLTTAPLHLLTAPLSSDLRHLHVPPPTSALAKASCFSITTTLPLQLPAVWLGTRWGRRRSWKPHGMGGTDVPFLVNSSALREKRREGSSSPPGWRRRCRGIVETATLQRTTAPATTLWWLKMVDGCGGFLRRNEDEVFQGGWFGAATEWLIVVLGGGDERVSVADGVSRFDGWLGVLFGKLVWFRCAEETHLRLIPLLGILLLGWELSVLWEFLFFWSQFYSQKFVFVFCCDCGL
ncbi:hypothetical protein Droror1_Dr00010152 [Drosera rotundifolia]